MGAKKHEEHENHERWLVSYADFITLLFAFFVVLYATSNADMEKQEKFEESVRSEFKMAVVATGGQAGNKGWDESGNSFLPELIPDDVFPRRGGPREVHDYIERQLRTHLTEEERARYVQEVVMDPMGARVVLASSSFFPSGDAKLLRSSLEVLNKIADILKPAERKIMIEGHTDNVPIKSTQFPSNWELAGLRATSVVRYLINYRKFDPSRLGAISYADQVPRAPNDTEANRSKNRRIEILVTTVPAETN